MTAEALDVGDQVVGGVGGQVDIRGACMGRAATAVALNVEDDPVAVGIEEAAVPRGAAGAGAAVEDEGGLALGVAAGPPIQDMSVADVESAAVVGLEYRIEDGHDLALPNGSALRGRRRTATECPNARHDRDSTTV